MLTQALMGNNNVDALLWAQPPVERLPGDAFRLLLLMAKRAHDTRRLYYGGLEHLAINMPYAHSVNRRRLVLKDLAALQDAGYVFRTDKREGHKRVYELRIPGIGGPVDNPP